MHCHLGIRFRFQVVRYASAMESLALSLLPVFATALDLDKNFFETAFKSPMFRHRLSHYPPANPDTDQYGIAPHTDTSFLTLLAQDQEGLVVSSPSGRWTRVPNCPSLLVVNITLHCITGGHYITLLVVNITLLVVITLHYWWSTLYYITLLVVITLHCWWSTLYYITLLVVIHYTTGGHYITLLVVNTGELLRQWANDCVSSTPHFVVNLSEQSRYSLPFFFNCSPTHVMSCLPSCTSEFRPPRYPAISFLQSQGVIQGE